MIRFSEITTCSHMKSRKFMSKSAVFKKFIYELKRKLLAAFSEKNLNRVDLKTS